MFTNRLFSLQINNLLHLMGQNAAAFLQAQHLTGASDRAVFMGCPGEWLSTILLFTSALQHFMTPWKHYTSPIIIKHPSFPHSFTEEKPNESINPSPSAHAWWWRPLIIRISLRGTQVCGGGPPASVIRHRGQTRASLERLRHVPREGSTPPSPPRPSEDSLFTPPDGGWIWVLMNAILHQPL